MQGNPATENQALLARLDAIFEPLDKSDAPGLIVGIALRGQVLYRRGFGLASVQHGVANQPATRMRIASTSKHFTCLAALLLVEDGLLDVDAPVTRFLPELASAGEVPSLRQFMNHTSGVRCTLDMGTLANGMAVQPSEWQLDALLRQSALNFAPGQGQMYSNGTFHALSLVIERVAGMPFERFLKQRIFEPLGLHDTDSIASDSLMVPGMASPHVPAPKGGWARPPSDADLRGDGGMVSTIDDMLRWLAHLNGSKRIGSAETWQQMLEPAVLANGSRSTYALGLKRHDYRGVEIVHHSGGLFGLNTQMLSVPAYGLDVVILVNGAPVSATQLSRQVVDAVLGEALPQPPRRLASDEGLGHLAGAIYQGPGGLLIAFGSDNGQLTLSLQHLQAMPILYDEGDSLRAGFEEIGLGPYLLRKSDLAADSTGQPPARLAMQVSGSPLVLERLPPPPPNPQQALQALVGSYASPDLAAEAEIATEGTGFVLRMKGDYSGTRPLDIAPLSTQVFSIEERLARGTRYPLTAQFDPSGQVTGFWIDTLRARRLWFARQTTSITAS